MAAAQQGDEKNKDDIPDGLRYPAVSRQLATAIEPIQIRPIQLGRILVHRRRIRPPPTQANPAAPSSSDEPSYAPGIAPPPPMNVKTVPEGGATQRWSREMRSCSKSEAT